jgi:acetyl esterase/lipase
MHSSCRKFLSFLQLVLACWVILPAIGGKAWAEPTEEREWTSTTGTRVQAAAVKLEGDGVRLRKPDGKEIVVPITKFSQEDQSLLRDHFGADEPPAAAAVAGKTAALSKPLAHPSGTVSGPHDAGQGSHYFIYIPKSLKENRKAPLLLYTGPTGGTAGHVKAHIKGAEVNGWIVAANVESKNKSNEESNHAHAKRCVEHLIETLPIDPDRVYFTGTSGGGAMAFINSAKIRSAGAMPIIGYNSAGKYAKGGHYYVLGGATDFNRYLSADAADGARDRGFHRIYPGAHADPPPWIRDEAMAWLNGRYLETKKSDREFAEERLDWESAMIAWITELKAATPYRAYYWCRFLQDSYKISGPNAAALTALAAELGKDPLNGRYVEGMEAIDAFSKRHYTGHGGGSAFSHTTPRIESAAKKLQEKMAGVPHIEDVAKQLGLKTCKK